MPPLFFFGTLRFRPLLAAVLGREPAVEDATLPGFRTVWARGEAFPMLVTEAGGTAQGILVRDVSEAELARLRYYEGAFRYDLVAVEVAGPDGPEPAQVFMPAGGPVAARRAVVDGRLGARLGGAFADRGGRGHARLWPRYPGRGRRAPADHPCPRAGAPQRSRAPPPGDGWAAR